MPIHKEIDTKFFKKWTSEMAYILGFFAADGSMIKNKRGAHFIEFNTVDKNLLEKIKKVLKSGHKISGRKRSKNCKVCYRLQIGSKTMFDDLSSVGFVSCKNKRMKLPNLPKKYASHFIRGYFDGDGHVCISQYIRKSRHNKRTRIIISGFTSGAKEFLNSLWNYLKGSAGLIGGSLFFCKGYRLSFSARDSLALYNFMYKNSDSSIFLERKRKIFEKYFNMDP